MNTSIRKKLARELATEGFEEVFLELLDQTGYVMSQADRIEVSDCVHNQFDGNDGCPSYPPG